MHVINKDAFKLLPPIMQVLIIIYIALNPECEFFNASYIDKESSGHHPLMYYSYVLYTTSNSYLKK